MTEPASSEIDDRMVDTILTACFERPEGEWAGSIDAACEAHPRLGPALHRRAALLGITGMLGGIENPRERVGRYRLLSALGSGGMGVVYHAEDIDDRSPAAVKIGHDRQLGSPLARARFEREIAAVKRLEHPNVVKLLEAGTSDGIPFIAMERLSGMSLAELLAALSSVRVETIGAADVERAFAAKGAASALPWNRGEWPEVCLRLAAEVAKGLCHAHSMGVVHRDVKPSNIMLTFDGRVVLLDFGLAFGVGEESLTRTGVQIGSLPYMAPEQVRGGNVDVRTDVYGLGVTLYEMLTFAQPFWNARSETLLGAILEGRPLRARLRNRNIDRDTETVCHKAFDLEPAGRFGSMASFLADIEAILGGRRVRARRPRWTTVAIRWARRRPAVATALIAMAASLVVVPAAIHIATLSQRDRATLLGYAATVSAASEDLRSGGVLAARDKLMRCPEQLRGFEWYLLDHRQDTSVAQFLHPGRYLQRGRWCGQGILTVDEGGIVRCLSQDGSVPRWIVELPSPLHGGIAVDSTRGLAAVAAGDGNLHVLDVATGAEQGRVRLDRVPRSIGEDCDGRILGTDDRGVFRCDFHDPTSWSRVVERPGLWGVLELDRERMLLLSDNDLRCLSVPSGTETPLVDSNAAYAVAKSSTHVALGRLEGRVSVYSAADLSLQFTLAGHSRRDVVSVCFSGDGKWIASGGRDGAVYLWDAARGTLVDVLLGLETYPTSIDLDFTGEVVLATSARHRSRVWRQRRRADDPRFQGTGRPVGRLLWSRTDQRLYSVDYAGVVTAWSVDGERAWQQPVGRDIAEQAGGPLMAGLFGETVVCFDRSDGRVRWRADCGFEATCVAFTPDGAAVMVGGVSKSIVVFDVRDPQKRRSIPCEPRASELAFDEHGNLWLDQNREMVAIDPRDGRRLRAMSAPGPVHQILFSRDGSRLYVTEAFEVNVTDLRTSKRENWVAHSAWVRGMDMSPDGTRIATGSSDGTVRIWLADSGHCVATIDVHGDLVSQVAFSPDGTRLAVAGDRGDITILDGRR